MSKPLFLVYTDHPMCSIDCADAVCEVLNESGLYDARMVGPDSHPKTALTKALLKKADCVVFGGGLGDSDQFDDTLYSYSASIKNYVKNGGKYLGICMGSYFSGSHYFDLLLGYDAVQYIKRKGSTVKVSGPSIVKLVWNNGQKYSIYFHDGAAFVETPNIHDANIIARYKNGDIAALIQDHKKGKIGVIGPHPEARKWWFYSQTKIKDNWKNSVHPKLLLDFVKQLLK